MINSQNSKFVLLIPAQAIVDDAYFAGSHQHGSINNTADTLGFDYATITFCLGASDIAVAELSLYGSDDGTTYTLITASNMATAGIGTLPSATDDNTAVRWYIDLRKTGGTAATNQSARYYRINAKAGNGSTGSFAFAYCELYRGVNVPNSATTRGLSQQVIM